MSALSSLYGLDLSNLFGGFGGLGQQVMAGYGASPLSGYGALQNNQLAVPQNSWSQYLTGAAPGLGLQPFSFGIPGDPTQGLLSLSGLSPYAGSAGSSLGGLGGLNLNISPSFSNSNSLYGGGYGAGRPASTYGQSTMTGGQGYPPGGLLSYPGQSTMTGTGWPQPAGGSSATTGGVPWYPGGYGSGGASMTGYPGLGAGQVLSGYTPITPLQWLPGGQQVNLGGQQGVPGVQQQPQQQDTNDLLQWLMQMYTGTLADSNPPEQLGMPQLQPPPAGSVDPQLQDWLNTPGGPLPAPAAQPPEPPAGGGLQALPSQPGSDWSRTSWGDSPLAGISGWATGRAGYPAWWQSGRESPAGQWPAAPAPLPSPQNSAPAPYIPGYIDRVWGGAPRELSYPGPSSWQVSPAIQATPRPDAQQQPTSLMGLAASLGGQQAPAYGPPVGGQYGQTAAQPSFSSWQAPRNQGTARTDGLESQVVSSLNQQGVGANEPPRFGPPPGQARQGQEGQGGPRWFHRPPRSYSPQGSRPGLSQPQATQPAPPPPAPVPSQAPSPGEVQPPAQTARTAAKTYPSPYPSGSLQWWQDQDRQAQLSGGSLDQVPTPQGQSRRADFSGGVQGSLPGQPLPEGFGTFGFGRPQNMGGQADPSTAGYSNINGQLVFTAPTSWNPGGGPGSGIAGASNQGWRPQQPSSSGGQPVSSETGAPSGGQPPATSGYQTPPGTVYPGGQPSAQPPPPSRQHGQYVGGQGQAGQAGQTWQQQAMDQRMRSLGQQGQGAQAGQPQGGGLPMPPQLPNPTWGSIGRIGGQKPQPAPPASQSGQVFGGGGGNRFILSPIGQPPAYQPGQLRQPMMGQLPVPKPPQQQTQQRPGAGPSYRPGVMVA